MEIAYIGYLDKKVLILKKLFINKLIKDKISISSYQKFLKLLDSEY